MIYVIFWLDIISIYLIRKTKIALLLTKKIIIPKKYSDFFKYIFKKKTLILLKLIKFN